MPMKPRSEVVEKGVQDLMAEEQRLEKRDRPSNSMT